MHRSSGKEKRAVTGTQEMPGKMTIRLLGSMEVQVGSAPLPPLRGRSSLWLLALLILRHDREVDRSWLAGTLWPDSLERQALANLRRTLTDLRTALGDAAVRLQAPALHTLRFCTADADIDVLAFDAAIAQGETEALENAVRLYRGHLLEGCTEEWIALERSSREQAYLQALETLATRARARQDVETTQHCLRRIIALDPLQESAQRSLMQSLADSANFAAAIQVYQEFRAHLHRALNTEPAAETVALYRRIRQEAAQRLKAGPLPSLPSAARENISPPRHLPRPLTRLIGRGQELAAIEEALTTSRLVTLVGSGGVGKTRLAIEAAEETAGDFADAVWFVDLAPVSDPAYLLRTVSRILKVDEQTDTPLAETLVAFLQRRNLLLVLDNCEHLIGACAMLAETLLQSCPHLKILATSREPLNVPGETSWRVPPLALPNARQRPLLEKNCLSLLLEHGAVRLFVERAGSPQPGFRLTEENMGSVVQICRYLDGIPLAVELAAARLDVLSVEQIAARLQSAFSLLTRGRRTAPPHQQTLRSTMDWSYGLLSAAEQKLLSYLSVFVGGFTLEAAEAVCGSDDALDGLSSLSAKSLVEVHKETDGSRRYRLLQTVAAYGQEKLAARDESDALRKRHCDYFLQLAEDAARQMEGADLGAWLDRLDCEHDNMRAALDYCAGVSPADETESHLPDAYENSFHAATAALRLAGALARFWYIRDYSHEGLERLAQILSLPGAAQPTPLRVRALQGAADLAWFVGDHPLGRALLDESLQIARQIGDTPGIANALHGLGCIPYSRREYEQARLYWTECLLMRRELGDLAKLASGLYNVGHLAYLQGRFEEARGYLEESLAVARQQRNSIRIANALKGLGDVARDQEDYPAARTHYEESLALYRLIGDKHLIVGLLTSLGAVSCREERLKEAGERIQEALTLARELSFEEGTASALQVLGDMAQRKGEQGKAARIWCKADALRKALQAPLHPVDHAYYAPRMAAASGFLPPPHSRDETDNIPTLEQAMASAFEEISTP